MKLLLHCCCGPCTTVVADHFARGGETVVGWYHNPNIGPEEEWRRRREAFSQAAQALGLPTRPVGEEPRFAAFLLALARGRGPRCHACYRLRLEAVARAAAAEGYEAFGTTLTVSPYQDHAALQAVGNDVATQTGVRFVYADVRPRYAESQARARELGIYRQNSCGCVFSALERAVRRAERAIARALRSAGEG